LAEWKSFADAVRARVPRATFAGPDTAGGTDWVAAMAKAKPEGLVLLSSHYYAGGPGMTPERLLRSLTGLKRTLVPLRDLSRRAHIPYRITEGNSSYHGGQQGVGNTFVSALWGVDFLFQLATYHAAGMNFHGGTGGVYTPIARQTSTDYYARPLYYGMLLFSQAARGHLAPVAGGPEAGVGAYATHDGARDLRLVVINRDSARATRLSVDPGHSFRHGEILRLSAPALDSADEVTLGGAGVSSDGAWTPKPGDSVQFQGRQFTLQMPAGSAALVKLSE
jgi:hypothetical protein